MWDRQDAMWERELKRWDAERALWTVKEERLQQQIGDLQALVVSERLQFVWVPLYTSFSLINQEPASLHTSGPPTLTGLCAINRHHFRDGPL